MSLLSVQNVGKAFRTYKSEWHRFANWFGLKIKPAEEHWVLRHINFEIHAGEAIGIIGQNGAGKSTLLKMITGTLQPSEGTIHVNGRIAAILELGMGFDVELTGRQNVFHAAGLMGFSSEETQQAIQNIESFADIGEYFDEPVRVYSTGMQVRVAFSVATMIRPEILIIDEALAVGDISFQQKCYKKIREFKEQGTALIFVTHDLGVLYSLCDQAIYLRDNTLFSKGSVKEVAMTYEHDMKSVKVFPETGFGGVSSSSGLLDKANQYLNVQLEAFLTRGNDGDSVCSFAEGGVIGVNIFCVVEAIQEPHLGFQIRDNKNNIIYETNTYCLGKDVTSYYNDKGALSLSIFLKNNLCKGRYTISFGLASKGYGDGTFEEIILDQVSEISFSVFRDSEKKWSGFTNMYAE